MGQGLLSANIEYSAVRGVIHVHLVEGSLSGHSGGIQSRETLSKSVGGLKGGMRQPVAASQLIYVVDDDVSIARLVLLTLESHGYQVKQFHTGRAVLEGLKGDNPDLIILDIVMPGANGVEVAKQVRQSSRVPIIMLSVRDDVTTKLAALDIGADDYLTKPFEIEELVARVRAILRRTTTRSSQPRPVYQSGLLCIDLEGGQVTVNDQPIKLTPHEWAVLRMLAKYTGQAVTSRKILQEAWGPDYGDEGDYIRAYISRLRRRLEPDPKHPHYILLERGFGYRLADPE
jgi:two-component system KDP operon response regulator KdpE